MQPSIGGSLRYAKLIGPSNDKDNLQQYSNQLLYSWIEEQLQYFPIGRRILSEWIVIAGDLFDSVIVRDELAITQMPAVQLSSLLGSSTNKLKSYIQDLKSIFVDAINMELKDCIDSCHVPSKMDVMNATKSNPLDWDAYSSLRKNNNQSEESFTEQKLGICGATENIDKYCYIGNLTYTKNVEKRVFPGSGKHMMFFVYSYVCTFKGSVCTSHSCFSKKSKIQRGGTHWHVLFCLNADDSLRNHGKAELFIIQIIKNQRNCIFC